MKFYILSTRYIDGCYYIFCLTERSKPVTLCVVRHNTYLYAKSKKPHGSLNRVLLGEKASIVRDLESGGVQVNGDIEIKYFHDAQLFSFHKTPHYKVPVNGYKELLKAKGILTKQGFSVAEFPLEESKLYSDLRIHHTQWIEVNDSEMDRIDIRNYLRNRPSEEYMIRSSSIKGIKTEDAPPAPQVLELIFDIETFASNYGINNSLEMPDHTKDPDLIYMISAVLTWSNSNEVLKKKCFYVTRNGEKINRDWTQTYDTEGDALKAFFEFIREEDPDLIYGHNSSSYDFKYIAGRTAIIFNDFPTYGRLNSFKAKGYLPRLPGDPEMGPEPIEVELNISYSEKYVSKEWEGAGGTWHEYHIPMCYGRVILDTLILLKKLPSSPGTPGALQSHKLDDLGNYLLGERKTGMTYAETFIGYRSGDPEVVGKIADYCMQDSILCMRIMHKTGEWVATREASYIYFQDVNEVTVTGQTAKMYTLFLRILEEMDFAFHPIPVVSKFKVQGGHVEVPVKGKHCDVAVIDFASLYPSIMMAYNMCRSTYIKSLPNPLPVGYTIDDFVKYEIPIEIGVRELPARYEEAMAPPGNEEDIINVPGLKWKAQNPGVGFVDDADAQPVEIQAELIEDENYIKEIIRYNRLNPSYKESYVEMLRARFGKAPQKVYETMSLYFVKKEVRQGIIPMIEKDLKDRRGDAKKKMKSAKEAGDMISYEMFNQRQNAIKVVMNSIYGVLASVLGKMSALEVAAAVTYVGRREILRVKDFLVERRFRIIYGDTDSLMFQVPDYGEEERRQKDPNSIKLSAAVTPGVIETVEEVTKEINKTMVQPMKMEFEKLMNAIFVDRKRYMGYITYEDGKNYATPGALDQQSLPKRPIYVRGAASVRGDTTPFARQVYTSTLTKILADDTEESVDAFLAEKSNELLEDKVPKYMLSVSKMYSHSYVSDTAPMKVYANYLHSIGERADPGTKIPMVIAKPPAGYNGPLSHYFRPPTTEEPIYASHYVRLMMSAIEKLKGAAYHKVLPEHP